MRPGDRYFNNKLTISQIVRSCAQDFYHLQELESKSVLELIADPKDHSNAFYCFLSPVFFDRAFLSILNNKVLNRTKKLFEKELSPVMIEILEHVQSFDHSIGANYSKAEAMEMYLKMYNRFKYTRKNHIISLSRALYSAMTGNPGVLKDCAQSVAFYCKKDSIDGFEKAYNEEIYQQKMILIDLIFEIYPEEAKKHPEIQEMYLLKKMLKL